MIFRAKVRGNGVEMSFLGRVRGRFGLEWEIGFFEAVEVWDTVYGAQLMTRMRWVFI